MPERLAIHGGTPVIAPGLIRAFLVAWRTLAEVPVKLAGAFRDTFDGAPMLEYLEPRGWLRQELAESLRLAEGLDFHDTRIASN